MSEPSTPPASTSATASANLPLAEVEGGLTASPDSISELFARDPLSWSEADMTRMIAHYRERRKEFDLEEAKPKKAKVAKIPKEDLKGITGKGLLDLLASKGLGKS